MAPLHNNVFKVALLLLMGSILLAACKQDFSPQIIKSDIGHLVVEGMLNNGDSTHIRLSRSRPLNARFEKLEVNAAVSIESQNNESFLSAENSEHFGLFKRVPLEAIYNLGGTIARYTVVENGCLDCKGSAIKPDFWE